MNWRVVGLFVVALILVTVTTARAWDVDFSRRGKRTPQSESMKSDELKPSESKTMEPRTYEPRPNGVTSQNVSSGDVVPAQGSGYTVNSSPNGEVKKENRLDTFVQRAVNPSFFDRQEFVILNTGKGFVPHQIRLRKGLHYTAHIVNVNDEKKNVSFMLDGFAQHHATYFGKIKSFQIDPGQEGIFEFICPETSAKGELVIFGGNPAAPVEPRRPSSD